MALGATTGRVRGEILSRVVLLVASGIAIGGLASLGLTPALRTFLVGISPFDPIAFGGAALLRSTTVGPVSVVEKMLECHRDGSAHSSDLVSQTATGVSERPSAVPEYRRNPSHLT
jgi:hypothetical protein